MEEIEAKNLLKKKEAERQNEATVKLQEFMQAWTKKYNCSLIPVVKIVGNKIASSIEITYFN